jgi:signal peptidase I
MHSIRKEWDKYTDGWFGVIVYLFLGFAVAYGVNGLLGLALHTSTPVVAVFSDSMDPTFYKGDMIIVVGVDAKDVKVGDVLVFDSPGASYPIIHRVNQIRDGGIISKGDNNPATDEGRWGVIPFGNIYGKAILKVPMLGWVKILFVQMTGLG